VRVDFVAFPLLFILTTTGCAPLRPLKTLGTGPAWEATFSPDGRFVAAATADGAVRVWTTESGAEVARCDGYQPTYRGFNGRQLAFSPDGRQLAFVTRDGDVALWDWAPASDRRVRRFTGHPRAPVDLVITAAGQVVSVSGGYTLDVPVPATRPVAPPPAATHEPVLVIAWDARTGTELLRRSADDAAGILFATLAPDGRGLATLGIPGLPRRLADTPKDAPLHRELAYWNLDDGSCAWRKVDAGPSMLTHLALPHDGRLLYTSGLPGIRSAAGQLHDVASGAALRPVPIAGGTFAADGRTLVAVGDITPPFAPGGLHYLGIPIPPPPKPTIRLRRVDVATGQLVESRDVRTETHTAPLAWSPDLRSFVDRDLRLWRLEK
jgi:hypothetical protein